MQIRREQGTLHKLGISVVGAEKLWNVARLVLSKGKKLYMHSGVFTTIGQHSQVQRKAGD